MSNINKILITVVICVFMVCTATVSVVKIVHNGSPSVTDAGITTEVTTDYPVSQTETTSASDQTTSSVYGTSAVNGTTSSVYAPTTVVAQEQASLAEALLGKWTDSAGMSGYEFFSDGSVNMTYVNLASFNIPFDGTAKGVYTLEGDVLTVKFSIYSATIQNTYKIKVEGNVLTMFNTQEYATSTYSRVS